MKNSKFVETETHRKQRERLLLLKKMRRPGPIPLMKNEPICFSSNMNEMRQSTKRKETLNEN